MPRSCFLVLAVLSGIAGLVTPGRAQGVPARPAVWIMPPSIDNGAQIQALFDHPEQWAQTRSRITGLGVADHVLFRDFSPEQLQGWARAMKQWNLKMSLEVGAVKPWGLTGQSAFDHEKVFWDKYLAAGGTIDAIAMDEPLICTRFHLHQPDAYALQETASFIQLVRQHYPGIKIGDIEGFPSIGYDDMTRWIDALQGRLKAMGLPPLDFFRVDTDWVHFVADDRKGSWPMLRKLEQFCRARHLPFSLCYWAADYPALSKQGLANDSTWYISLMQMGYDYRLVQGAPDEMVIESWVAGPSQSLPETGEWTFTRSVLDFCKTFAP